MGSSLERARIAEDVLSFAIDAPNVNSQGELQDLLDVRVQKFGVTHFAACIMTDSQHRFTPGPMFGKINVAWGAAYFEHHLYRDDPVIAHALKQARGAEGAFWGSAFEEGRLSKGGKRVLDMAAGAGLRDGYLMPVEVRRGDIMFVSYQGERLDHDPMVQAALTSYGQVFARIGQRLQDGKKSDGGRLSALSRQQILILELAGRGLTNADIAAKLGVATKTIEYHLWRARTHLGAANTKEAIAALREGINKMSGN